ncbi:precorrin-4 C(11)-methyltransferase [Corynebacterium sp. sy017]|uniref:precorrin-4 C(11)-methyltransferase n=1 Tax=unclassified Corynebacterium TaxID=2624378 RepID=UPI001186C393|nr:MULTISPECIES: precorrin-4 C(11)-methyltransferase [unclassified Corynebacterium]MBP3087598.1 precorrin-4 C(11)-methyltransferase [Corynebacterium sp. sy017]QDZ42594.1 precorrin-4 C(11)-methyltransferase [Corynebacterium sp. sy039]TSD92168.1 precorrin-4 C(11)-methyltransferase [Corynebacterium sp. SY003]
MTVYFIGAGPGAADLLTLRADKLIRSCQVCLYAGSIVPQEVLEHTPEGAQVINTARMPLDEIISLIIAADEQGHDVARLHSGDTSIYSALAEQLRRLEQHKIQYEIVPGVTAFSAAAAVLGRELTVPTVGQTVILTRVQGRASRMPVGEDLHSLGQSRATMVIHLAVHDIRRVVRELTPNYGDDCPCAVVAYASRPEETICRGTLQDIAEKVEEAQIQRTAVIIVGNVLTADTFSDSYLYSLHRPRDEEGRTIPCVR